MYANKVIPSTGDEYIQGTPEHANFSSNVPDNEASSSIRVCKRRVETFIAGHASICAGLYMQQKDIAFSRLESAVGARRLMSHYGRHSPAARSGSRRAGQDIMTLNVVRRKHPYCIWHTSSTRIRRAYSAVLLLVVCTGRHVPWRSGMSTALTRHPFVSIPPLALVPMIVGRYCTSCTPCGKTECRTRPIEEPRTGFGADLSALWGPKRSNRRPCQSKCLFVFPSSPTRCLSFEGAELGQDVSVGRVA